MNDYMEIPFQRVLDFLDSHGFIQVSQNGSCVTLRHQRKNLIVTICTRPAEPLRRGLITRLLLDLELVDRDLGLCKGGGESGTSTAILNELGGAAFEIGSPLSLIKARECAERYAIQAALRRHNGKIAPASAELGVSRPTLYELMSKFDIQKI